MDLFQIIASTLGVLSFLFVIAALIFFAKNYIRNIEATKALEKENLNKDLAILNKDSELKLLYNKLELIEKHKYDIVDSKNLSNNNYDSSLKHSEILDLLTEAEYEIGSLLSEGKSYKEIADIRHVEVSTLKRQINSLYTKVKINDKTLFAKEALINNWFPQEVSIKSKKKKRTKIEN